MKSFSVALNNWKKGNRRSTLFALSQVNEGDSERESETNEIDDFLLGEGEETKKFFGNTRKGSVSFSNLS